MSDTCASTALVPGHAAVAEKAGYALVGPLWRDGLSVCYRASHRRLDRAAVLKMADAGPPQAARVRAELLAWEARILSRLDHPNVVRLYDFGIIDEQPYLLLEYPP